MATFLKKTPRYIFALACYSLIIIDVLFEKFQITLASSILMLVAILPWAAQILDSFSFSEKGVSAKLRQRVDILEESTTEGDADEIAEIIQVSENELNILKALVNSEYIARSISGIRKETGIKGNEVVSLLHEMEDKKFCREVTRPNGPRWIIRPLGRLALTQKDMKVED